MVTNISNILATIFFALAFIWFVIAVSYAASVVLFLKMRREGRFNSVRFNDPEFGRYYLCGSSGLYLPMGWIFRRFILQYQNEQERRSNKGRVMNKTERRQAMKILLCDIKKTKTQSSPPKESSSSAAAAVVVDMDTSADTSSSSESDNETTDGRDDDHPTRVAAAAGDIEACCEVSSVSSSNDVDNDDDVENVCSICLGHYGNEASEWSSPVCKHKFHRECLLAWLEQPGKTECPCCRKDFVEEDRVWKAVKQLRRKKRRKSSTDQAIPTSKKASASAAGDPESPSSSLEANNVDC